MKTSRKGKLHKRVFNIINGPTASSLTTSTPACFVSTCIGHDMIGTGRSKTKSNSGNTISYLLGANIESTLKSHNYVIVKVERNLRFPFHSRHLLNTFALYVVFCSFLSTYVLNLTKMVLKTMKGSFFFAASYDVQTIERAFQDYHRYTCLKFEPFNGHRNYIYINNGAGWALFVHFLCNWHMHPK